MAPASSVVTESPLPPDSPFSRSYTASPLPPPRPSVTQDGNPLEREVGHDSEILSEYGEHDKSEDPGTRVPAHLSLAVLNTERMEGQEAYRSTAHEFANLSQAFRIYLDTDQALQDQLQSSASKVMEIWRKKQVPPRIPDRVMINLNTLNSFPNLRSVLALKPYLGIPAFEAALADYWSSMSDEKKLKTDAPKVAVYGFMHERHVTPRGLNSAILGKLVCIEGVVNKCTAVVPKVVKAVYVAEGEGEQTERSVFVRDVWDITNFDKTLKDLQPPPQKDPSTETTFKFETGLSIYKNRQRFVLQEAPECAPTGQMPRSVEVLAEDDLVNNVKCGDRVRVWGVLRMNIPRVEGALNGTFRSYFVANTIANKNSGDSLMERRRLSSEQMEKFIAFSKMPGIFEILGNSIAPSICGHREIKLGLVLMLLGGSQIEKGTHRIRGDIHVLLVGDPSCGKSQLLRYIMKLMPGSISATGRGSSGVGLTAAVVTDSDTGERRVEGGATVMGDRHIVCIDEFDKMHQNDTVAIHEVMEQQTVTVAKAGIHTVLNARCSILAAANPIYGCWSEEKDYGHQLNFPPSLMSRFDLVFVVKDSSHEQSDDKIADVVLSNFRNICKSVRPCSRKKTEEESRINIDIQGYQPKPMITDASQSTCFQMYAQHNISDSSPPILTPEFLKNYIIFAKKDFYAKKHLESGWEPHPVISTSAHKRIINFFSEIRQSARPSVLATITVRTLEGIVRLASAHARLKLKRYVEKSDVDVAISLVKFTVLGEPIPTEEDLELLARRKRMDYDSSDDSSDSDFQAEPAASRRRPNNNTNRPPHKEDGQPSAKKKKPTPAPFSGVVAQDRIRVVMRAITQYFQRGCYGAPVGLLLEAVNESVEETQFGMDEFKAALESLENVETHPIVYDKESGTVYAT